MARNHPGSSSTNRRLVLSGIGLTAFAIVAALGILVVHGHATITSAAVASDSSTTASPTTTANPATTAGPPTTASSTTPGSVSPTTGAPAAVAATTDPTASAPALPPHFDTPQAAMTYLAAAWNSRDIVDLNHVTNPAARAQLVAMRSEAVNLRLDHCTGRPQGDYLCYFNHDYPAATATTLPGGMGQMVVLVGPARTPGWYMTVFVSCG